MEDIRTLRDHLTYKNKRIDFKKNADGTVHFKVSALSIVKYSGNGDDINDAIHKARALVDTITEKK